MVAAYLGRVLDGWDEPAGTCFQVEAGVLVTAWHVVEDVGSGRVGDEVRFDPLGGGEPASAVVAGVDVEHDLAVLTVSGVALSGSVAGLVPSASVAVRTDVTVTGVSQLDNDEVGLRYKTALGRWSDSAMRLDQTVLGVVESQGVLRGMSGAPVVTDAGWVIGVVSARYNSADGWARDTVWLSRSEELEQLLRGHADGILPSVVIPADLPDEVDEPALLPLGIGENLEPVLLDLFGIDQHFLVLGDKECGKTTLLRGVAEQLMARHSWDDIVIALFDRRMSLANLVPDRYLGGHATNPTLAAGLVDAICADLETRSPDLQTDTGWAGPHIVLLVDDYDVLTAGGHTPLARLTEFLPAARDLGLHVILARPVAGAAAGIWDPVVAQLRDSGAATLVMDGDRSEGALVPGVYAARQPTGRGLLVRRGHGIERIQTACFTGNPSRGAGSGRR